MIKPNTFQPENLLGSESVPDWKVKRFPFEETVTETLARMKNGFLVKFNATEDGVIPALAADDAALAGVIVGLPDDAETGVGDPAVKTVAVALQGTFNQNAVQYADAWDTENITPLSAEAIERLRLLNIFLDPAVRAGAFTP